MSRGEATFEAALYRLSLVYWAAVLATLLTTATSMILFNRKTGSR